MLLFIFNSLTRYFIGVGYWIICYIDLDINILSEINK